MSNFSVATTSKKFAALVMAFTSAMVLPLAGCTEPDERVAARGDVKVGEKLIHDLGCGSCHHIPGISGADGEVGPPLKNIEKRAYLAGIVPNSFDNLVVWLTETQRIAPESAMPDLGLSEAEAKHIAAYLYEKK